MFDALRRSDPDDFEFDWSTQVIPRRVAGTSYKLDQLVRPLAKNGYWLKCTVAGETQAREPSWVKQSGALVVDGTVTWQIVAPDDVNLPTIQSATYAIEPTGIAQSDSRIDGMLTTIRLDAVAAELGSYRLVAEITLSTGEDYSIDDTFPVID